MAAQHGHDNMCDGLVPPSPLRGLMRDSAASAAGRRSLAVKVGNRRKSACPSALRQSPAAAAPSISHRLCHSPDHHTSAHRRRIRGMRPKNAGRYPARAVMRDSAGDARLPAPLPAGWCRGVGRSRCANALRRRSCRACCRPPGHHFVSIRSTGNMRALIGQAVAPAARGYSVVHRANIGTGEAGLPRRAWVVARGRRDAPPARVWGAAASVRRGRAPAPARPAPTPARPAPARPTPTPARPAPARPTPTPARPAPAPAPARSDAEAKAAPEAAIEATVEPAEAASAKAAMKPAEATSAEAAMEPASAALREGGGHARCETRHDKRCRN